MVKLLTLLYMEARLLSNKLIILSLLMAFNSSAFCLSDSLYIKELLKFPGNNVFILLHTGSGAGTEKLTTVVYVEAKIYEKFYIHKYRSLYEFLYAVVNHKLSIPLSYVSDVNFEKLETTEISLKTMGKFPALFRHYLKSGRTGEWKLKQKLPEVQKNDLIRLMLKLKFIAYIQCDSGELVFWK